MIIEIKAVPLDIIMKAQKAVAKGPRGDAMVTIVGALHKDHDHEDVLAVITRLQALATTIRDADLPELSMTLHGKEYKLVNEAAFAAAASTKLTHEEGVLVGDIAFDKNEFLKNALAYMPERGSA